jgi:hypothetical protein
MSVFPILDSVMPVAHKIKAKAKVRDCNKTVVTLYKTSEEVIEVTRTHMKFLISLFERWQDEKEYEDIEDYRVAARDRMDIAVLKCFKEPFGFYLPHRTGAVKLTMIPDSDDKLTVNWEDISVESKS